MSSIQQTKFYNTLDRVDLEISSTFNYFPRANSVRYIDHQQFQRLRGQLSLEDQADFVRATCWKTEVEEIVRTRAKPLSTFWPRMEERLKRSSRGEATARRKLSVLMNDSDKKREKGELPDSLSTWRQEVLSTTAREFLAERKIINYYLQLDFNRIRTNSTLLELDSVNSTRVQMMTNQRVDNNLQTKMMMRAQSLLAVGSSTKEGTKASAEATTILLTELKKLLTSRVVINHHTKNHSLTSDVQVLADFPQKLDDEAHQDLSTHLLPHPRFLPLETCLQIATEEDEGNVKELRNLRNVSNDPPT